MSEKKICPLCTKLIDSWQGSCPFCGYEFHDGQSRRNPPDNDIPPARYQQQRSRPSKGFIDVGIIVVIAVSFIGAVFTVLGDMAKESFLTVTISLVFSFLFFLVFFYILYWIISKVYPASCGWGILGWIIGLIGMTLIVSVILAFVFGMMGGMSDSGPDPASSQSQGIIQTETPLYVTLVPLYTTIDPYARQTWYPTPTSSEVLIQKPRTGTIVSGYDISGGKGELKIDNTQGRSDAVAVVTKNGSKNPVSSVFIRSGEVHTFYSIPDGNYDLYIMYGENWNINAKKFVDNIRYEKFEDSFPYTTTKTTTYDEIITHYTTWRVTLYSVVAGNADTDTLSEDSFPDI